MLQNKKKKNYSQYDFHILNQHINEPLLSNQRNDDVCNTG